jgi:hypothetical protein
MELERFAPIDRQCLQFDLPPDPVLNVSCLGIPRQPRLSPSHSSSLQTVYIAASSGVLNEPKLKTTVESPKLQVRGLVELPGNISEHQANI